MPAQVINGLENFPQKLYDHAKNLFTAFGLFMFDDETNTLAKVSNIEARRSELLREKLTVPSWLSFHVGVECLLKAVLLKNEISIITKRKVTEKDRTLNKSASNYHVACRVYEWPKCFLAGARGWPWLQQQLKEKEIRHSYDINTGTLGTCRNKLSELRERKRITNDEYGCLFNALTVFSDVRRNTDAHTFFGWTVGGSINGDLDNVYVPMVNLLFDIYHRM